jgi:ferrochelatase
MALGTGTTAVVLFQLGGPDSLDAVEPFLYNLFCDPDIIDFPGAFLARKALARFIASRRGPKVAAHYAEIGGKSPIVDLTNAQAQALQRELGPSAKVFVAMRYWRPFTEDVVAELKKGSYDRVVLIPLYPQFSKATTVSSMKEWNRQCGLLGYTGVTTGTVCCYHNHPLYIEGIVENINAAYARFSGVDPAAIEIVFSAHGVPVSLIKGGDPYKLHIEETVRLTVERGAWRSPHRLCFQSKVGPAEWLKPSLDDTVHALAAEGRKHLLVVPIAFVTEHIETLHEIGIETREEAEALGITQFEVMPALNDHPKFIACLADLVRKTAAGTPLGLPSCRTLPGLKQQAVQPTLCPMWNSSAAR